MNYTYSVDGFRADFGSLSDGRTYGAVFRDLRRSGTGMHGMVALITGETIAAYDTFNIGRLAEREKLVRRGLKAMDSIAAAEVNTEDLQHDLDIACLHAVKEWEAQRFVIEEIDPDEEVAPRAWLLRPFIQNGGGSIFFGPPKSGKSYLLQITGLIVANGLDGLFAGVIKRPCLYVNIERAREEFLLRERDLRRILGLSGGSGLSYLHARGRTIRTVAPKVRQWAQEHPDGLVLYDSISRAGLGKLVDDETANAWTDLANALSHTWAAIAHTPRGDDTHSFGSVMYEAGQDVGIRVVSEQGTQSLGISLTVTQANAARKGATQYVALDFDQDDLSDVRITSATEFPGLVQKRQRNDEDEVFAYVLEMGKVSASQTSRETGVPRTTVAGWFKAKNGRYVAVGRDKHEVLYGILQDDGGQQLTMNG